MTSLHMELGDRSYDIHIGRGLLSRVGEYFSLDRRVLILTDDGVPAAYAEAVADACRTPTLVTVPQGEESKALSVWEDVLAVMLGEGFTRADAVVAVGGGVVGDLGGFVAASYMRGVDFYNIPTTLLSQVDSSIGGKTAVDFRGVKNIIGAFHQPRGVLIDPALLKTLDERQMASGRAGKPAPLPTSAMLAPYGMSAAAVTESARCFAMIPGASVMAVRFPLLFCSSR